MISRNDNRFHLSGKHLLRSVVDETELNGKLREHLSSCSLCREAKERIEKELLTMRRMAKMFAPVPWRKTFPLAGEEQPENSWIVRWRWTMAQIAITMVTLLMLNFMILNRIQEQKVASVYQEMLEDEAFITEVLRLEENALPQFYIDISNGFDPNLKGSDGVRRLPSNDGHYGLNMHATGHERSIVRHS